MRCPYCRQNIRVQGRFCPKCGEQIFGLPVRPPRAPAPPGGTVLPPTESSSSAPPARPSPPPPYRPLPSSSDSRRPTPPEALNLDVDIELEEEGTWAPAPPARTPHSQTHAQPTSIPGGAQPHLATKEEIGKTCPYCRFPIKPREQIIACPACELPHHADCWKENGGCTTYGCRMAPGTATSAPRPSIQPPYMPSPMPTPSGGYLPSEDFLRLTELAARAQNALVLAILGIFFFICGLPLSVVSIFMGFAVLAEAKRLRGRATEAHGKAVAAIILGFLAIFGWLLYLIIAVSKNS